MSITKEQIAGTIRAIAAIAATIQELGRVPSGKLYASVMGAMSLEQYNRVIATLHGAGLVKEENYELIWVGPQVKN